MGTTFLFIPAGLFTIIFICLYIKSSIKNINNHTIYLFLILLSIIVFTIDFSFLQCYKYGVELKIETLQFINTYFDSGNMINKDLIIKKDCGILLLYSISLLLVFLICRIDFCEWQIKLKYKFLSIAFFTTLLFLSTYMLSSNLICNYYVHLKLNNMLSFSLFINNCNASHMKEEEIKQIVSDTITHTQYDYHIPFILSFEKTRVTPLVDKN